MPQQILQIHPEDNVLVALQDVPQGAAAGNVTALRDVQAKHKLTTTFIPKGGEIIMYGVLVGHANEDLPAGELITTANVRHASGSFGVRAERKTQWDQPDVSAWKDRSFLGYHRTDGRVGTGNYWVILPLVFCENRNVQLLHETLVKGLDTTKAILTKPCSEQCSIMA